MTGIHLVPLGAPSGFRARDIADNDYAARFYTRDGDPDYTASDYDRASVTVAFERSGSFFGGTLDASGLKPSFAYQMKLVGMPTAEYGAAGDDVSNERIGYAGRWNRVGTGNATDAQYEACRADPQCDDVFEGYLVFDFFVTDMYGNATHAFVADDSFHVLWRDCPPERPLTGCQSPSGRPTVYRDVVALASTGYGYDRDYATWTIGVFGEVERTAPHSYLPTGEYRARFVLTEESFHESGVPGGYWASVIGDAGIHFWIDQTAGPRDCGDGDLCNGYEVCDGTGACQAGLGDVCDDGDLCTVDACDPISGCGHASLPLPPEVDDSVRLAKAGAVAEVSWSDPPGPFNVYRGSRSAPDPFAYDHACVASRTESPYGDATVPADLETFYYLVSRENACGQESSVGHDSQGAPDPNPSPCP